MSSSGISLPRKIALTAVTSLFIALLGTAYQYFYLEERVEYTRAIAAHYRKVHGSAPDALKLKHLVTLAMDRYGPTEFIRSEEDYDRLLLEPDE